MQVHHEQWCTCTMMTAMSDPEPTRVLLIEDHAMIAQGLRAALDQIDDIDVVAVAGTIEEGVQQARGHEPHVVLLDFRLPDGDAPDGIVRLHKARPDTKVLVVSALSDYRSVVRAMEAGAAGYLLKDQPIGDLISGIRRARAGDTVVAPSLVPRLLARITTSTAPTARLSRREIDVLQLLAEGLSTAELAARLNLSVNTVRNHVQSILTRLGAHSKLEAVSIALREGIINPPDNRRPSGS
jgi:DNA-binding NarL/FixJ family response regulator